MFVIYGLREAGSSEYRYEGSTVDADRRMWAHQQYAKAPETYGNHDLYQWFAANDVVMDTLEAVNDHPRQHEERWIQRLRAEGHRLLNMRSASTAPGGLADMPDDDRREIVTRYLDWFEDGVDKPWLKEDGPIWVL